MCLAVSVCHSSATKEQILFSKGLLEFICVVCMCMCARA